MELSVLFLTSLFTSLVSVDSYIYPVPKTNGGSYYTQTSGACYFFVSSLVTRTNSADLCPQLAPGANLMWFWNYGQWNTIMTYLTVENWHDYMYWVHLSKDTGNNEYLWMNGDKVDDSPSPWGKLPGSSSYTTNRGLNCVMWTNDVKESQSDYMWFVETECSDALSYFCRDPCQDTNGFVTLTTDQGDIRSCDLSEPVTFLFSSTHSSEVNTIDWYKNDTKVQTGSATSYILNPGGPEFISIIAVLTTQDGDYIKSDPYFILRTERPNVTIDVDTDVVRVYDNVVFECEAPTENTDVIDYYWYQTNTDPNVISPVWTLISPDFGRYYSTTSGTQQTSWFTCSYDTGDGESPKGHPPIRVTFSEPPIKPEINGISHGVDAGEMVSITCSLTSTEIGTSTIRWYSNHNLINGENSGVLVTTSTPGSVTYECTVQDTKGTSDTSDPWTVEYAFPAIYQFNTDGLCYVIINNTAAKDVQESECQALGTLGGLWKPYTKMEFDFLSTNLQYWLGNSEGRYYIDINVTEESGCIWGNGTSIEPDYLKSPKPESFNCFSLYKPPLAHELFIIDGSECSSEFGAICKIPCPSASMSPGLDASASIVDYGEEADITCGNPGSHEAHYHWIIDGVYNNTPSQGVIYSGIFYSPTKVTFQCLIQHFDGKWVISPQLTVTTLPTPEMIASPYNIWSYSTDTVVTLTCHVNLTDNIQFTWKRQTYNSVSYLTSPSNHYTPSTSSSYSATFECYFLLDGFVSSLADNNFLLIYDAPAMPTITYAPVSTLYAWENSPTMSCDSPTVVDESIAFYQWFDSLGATIGNSKTLTTTKPLPGFESYHCTVTDTSGTSTMSQPVILEYTLPSDFYFTAGTDACYKLYTLQMSNEDARDLCYDNSTASSLLQLQTQLEFDILTQTLAIVLPSQSRIWIQELYGSNNYLWGFDASPIDNNNYINGTDLAFTSHDCLVLDNSSPDGQYRLRVVSNCLDTNNVICKIPCDSEKGTIATVATDPVSSIHDTTDKLDISCTPAFSPVLVLWYQDGIAAFNTTTTTTKLSGPRYSTTFALSCVAVGQNGEMVLSDSVTLLYIETPFIISYPHGNLLSEYSSGTQVRLICTLHGAVEGAMFSWELDGVRYPGNTSKVIRNHRGEIQPNGYLSELFTCSYEIALGVSMTSPVYNVSFYPGPGLPTVISLGPSWVFYNLTVISFQCENSTSMVGEVQRYVWWKDNQVDDRLVNKTISVIGERLGFVNYVCAIEDEEGLSTISWKFRQLYTVWEMCIPDLCQNEGTCYAITYNTSACECVPGFQGELCEVVTAILISNEYEPNDQATMVKAHTDILTGVSHHLLHDLQTETYDRVSMSTEAVHTFSHRLIGHAYDPEVVSDITEATAEKSREIMDVMRQLDCRGAPPSVSVCQVDKTQEVFSKLETTIVNVGVSQMQSDPSLTSTNQTGNNTVNAKIIAVGDMAISLAQVDQDSMFGGVMQTVGAEVVIPPSLLLTNSSNETSPVMLVSIQYPSDPYFYQIESNISVVGPVYNFHLVDDQGQDVDVDPAEPVEITMEVSEVDQHEYSNHSFHSVHSIDLSGFEGAALVVVEFSVSSTQTLLLTGQRNHIPTEGNAEFNISVGKNSKISEFSNANFVSVMKNQILSVYVPLPNYSKLYFVSNYTDSSIGNASSIEASITSHGFYLNTWDGDAVSWKQISSIAASNTPFMARRRLLSTYDRQDVAVRGVSEKGSVKFSTNIFGSFAFSQFVIVPNLINFDNVLSNFSSLLADSPQVLALNCCILFFALLLVLYIRRFDKKDQLLWTYLPLVDNDNRDNALYTLSVHSGLSSPPLLTATPYLVIKGENGMTYKRVLCDGVRQNFGGSTVSNFVLQTPYWLGKLLSIKIWTDGLGQQPDWFLDRIVVTDVSANENYIFMCQDWLALSRGNGLLCHTIPAIQPSTEDMSLGFSIVSKKMLYDDHLWLSIVKRPGYSTFTRVQRFVLALALLYLAMLTNAMFYPTGQGNQTDEGQSTGLRIGVVEFGYREVYVGIVSAVVILIPGFFVSWIFMHRKLKDQSYEVVLPLTRPKLSLITPTLDTDHKISPNPLESKMTASMLNETEPVNYSIVFLKKVFLEYQQRIEHSPFGPSNWGYQSDSDEHKNFSEGEMSSMEAAPCANPVDILSDKYYDDLPSRRKQCEVKKQTIPFMLPWWFILIAYSLVISSIALSATLTIFYSLEWGSSTSNQWLMSLFLSTSTSTFVIEPVKILVVALILSCVFKQFGASSISTVAPFDKSKTPPAPFNRTFPIVEEPDTNTKEMKKRKNDLKLQQKLVGVWKSIGFRVTLVVLVGIVTLHAEVTTSYYQNSQLEYIMDKDHLEQNVTTESNIYKWLTEKVVTRALPDTLYNGQAMTLYDQKFISDHEHFRLGPIRIIQFRVKKSLPCDVRSKLHSYLKDIICLGNYEDDTDEQRDFAINWTSCYTSPCPEPYVFKSGAKWEYAHQGSVSTYGPGGYQVLLNSDHQAAMDTLSGLKGSEWIDERTRGILVELTVFNPSTRLFTQAKALIETPSFGSTVKTVTVKSARLYPYITVWDYLVLLFHLVYTFTQITRLGLLVSCLISPGEGETRCNFRNLAIFTDVICGIIAFVIYVVRLVLTPDLLERAINERDKFSSFDTVFLLDKIFVVCMGLSFFITILMCLSPLSLNYNLYIMKQTVSSASPQLSGFAFIMSAFLVAFTCYFTICRGSVTKNLSSFGDTLTSLLTVLLGHGKFRGVGGEEDMAETTGIDYISFRIMYGFFCFASAIFMINLAITILSAYITDVKDVCYQKRGLHPGYDPRLNQFMWNRIEGWIKQILFRRNSKSHQEMYTGSQFNVLPGSSKNTNEEYLRKGKFY